MQPDQNPPQARRVLIYRLGSLGDTVIALPCFHLIARIFPEAERILLTNIPINAKAPAAAAVLGDSELVQRYINYPVGTRNPLELGRLALKLRSLRADVLVYLAAPRGEATVQRDAGFFRLCGFRKIYGLPTGDLGVNRVDPATGLLEAESHRLARTLEPLGDARLEDDASWDFHLNDAEKQSVLPVRHAIGGLPYIVCSPGCKAPANDWEDQNWAALFDQLSSHLNFQSKSFALIMTGAEGDRARNDRLRELWRGPSLNLCGNTPREAAALLCDAAMYLGPDSGPMHIAAAVGTPCVSVFSARLGLGIWFPRGSQRANSRHQIVYYRTNCSPCGLETCIVEKKRCILSITPEQVLWAALKILQANHL